MLTVRAFPLGLICASSPCPVWNWICLEPAPPNGPQPPFFTLNSSLDGPTGRSEIVGSLKQTNKQLNYNCERLMMLYVTSSCAYLLSLVASVYLGNLPLLDGGWCEVLTGC